MLDLLEKGSLAPLFWSQERSSHLLVPHEDVSRILKPHKLRPLHASMVTDSAATAEGTPYERTASVERMERDTLAEKSALVLF